MGITDMNNTPTHFYSFTPCQMSLMQRLPLPVPNTEALNLNLHPHSAPHYRMVH